MVKQEPLGQAILKTIQYFSLFDYIPTQDEIYTYVSSKCTKQDVVAELNNLSYQKRLINNTGGGIDTKHKHVKARISQAKISSIKLFVSLLSLCPWIKLVGLSGSCSMLNAKEGDDIDIFIISAPGGIWLSRATAILIAKLLRKHRMRGSRLIRDKVCLNLFFDEGNLTVPEEKRNLYVAHEVVQMRPLYIRGGVYDRYLFANKWVRHYFPNLAISHVDLAVEGPTLVTRIFETITRVVQLRLMSRISEERVSNEQLWFFPRDYQKKIEKHIAI